jgi:hypothetical protein
MTANTHKRHFYGLAAACVIVAAVVLAVVVLPSGGHGVRHDSTPRAAVSVRPGGTPFAPNSIWNAPLSANVRIASNSTSLVSELQRQVATFGTWINTYAYSTPIYQVPASQPRVPVTLDQPHTSGTPARLATALGAGVPIPGNAQPAPGTDGAMVVWQPSSDTMWELWLAHRVGSTWHARWGGRMDDVSQNPGYFTDPPDWGTAATSLALMGGTVTLADLAAGQINHALAISIPDARQSVYALPAQRTDGKVDAPTAIPEGTRFRLDPTLNLDRLNLPPFTRMLAEAAQRYGIFVRDQSGTVDFYGQEVTATRAANPYYGPHGAYGGLNPRQLSQWFPWSHLEVVAAPLRHS